MTPPKRVSTAENLVLYDIIHRLCHPLAERGTWSMKSLYVVEEKYFGAFSLNKSFYFARWPVRFPQSTLKIFATLLR
jgi:hypothetical protein